MGGLDTARVRYRFYSALHSSSAYALAAETSTWAHRIWSRAMPYCYPRVSAAGNQDVLESTQYRDFYWLDLPFEPH